MDESKDAVYFADTVEVADDDAIDHGESHIEFRWTDPQTEWDCLEIDHDGFCSRRMPIGSGGGPWQVVELLRDRLRIRFSPELAGKLGLKEEIEIHFKISDAVFRLLERTLRCHAGEDV